MAIVIIYFIGCFLTIFTVRKVNKDISKGIVHSLWYTKTKDLIIVSSFSWVMVIACIFVLINERFNNKRFKVGEQFKKWFECK